MEIMETNETETRRLNRKLMVNRILLLAVIALQLAILVSLYWNRERANTDQSRLASHIDERRRQLAGDQKRHSSTMRATPVMSPAVTPNDPLANDPEEEALWPSPMAQMQAMQAHMNRMLQTASSRFNETEKLLDLDPGWGSMMASPTMDMRDQGDSYVLNFSLPGIDASEIEVALEGRLLSVYTSIDKQAPNHRSLSRFQRKVLLPGPVKGADSVLALATNGVLRITVPKAMEAKAGAALDRIPPRAFSGASSHTRTDSTGQKECSSRGNVS